MTDAASLGLKIDASQVVAAGAALDELKGKATGAAGGAKDFSAGAQGMSEALRGVQNALQQHTSALRDYTSSTKTASESHGSFVDSMLKWGTAAAAGYVAYKQLSAGADEYTSKVNSAKSATSSFVDALSNIGRYGIADAFNMMSAGALAAEKSFISLGARIGVTGAEVQRFVAMTAAQGTTPQQATSALSTLQYNLTANTEGALSARRTLEQYGVNPVAYGMDPDKIAQAFVNALHQVQPGIAQQQAATSVFGPEGASFLQDNYATVRNIGVLQGEADKIREATAIEELKMLDRRREIDLKAENYWSQTAGVAIFNPSAIGMYQASQTYQDKQILQGNVISGLMAEVQNALAIATGGGPAGTQGQPWWKVNYATVPTAAAMPAAPETEQERAQRFQDLAAAGQPQAQELQALVDLQMRINDDYRKGRISMEQWEAATTQFVDIGEKISNPLIAMASNLQRAAAIAAIPSGPAREMAQTRQEAATAYFMANKTLLPDVKAEDYWRHAGEVPTEYMQGVMAPAGAAAGAPFAQQLHEQQIRAQGAAALPGAAATGGEYAVQIARVGIEEQTEAYHNLGDAASRAAEAKAKIVQIDSELQVRSALFTHNVQMETDSLMAQFKAIAEGQSPFGVRAVGTAQRAAYQLRPDLGAAQGVTTPIVQTELQGQFAGGIGASSVEMEARLQTMLKLAQAQKEALSAQGGGAGGAISQLSQLRQQTGIDLIVQQLTQYKDLMTDPAIQTAIQGQIDKLSALAKQVAAIRTEAERMRLDKAYKEELSTVTGQANLAASGASDYQMQVYTETQKIQKQYQPVGGISDQDAVARAQALVQEQQALKDATDANKEWTDSIKSMTGTLADGLASAVTSTKGFGAALKDMLLGLSKEGVETFLTNPLKGFLDQMLTGGSQGGGLLSGGNLGGASAGANFAKQLFGTSSGSPGSGGANSVGGGGSSGGGGGEGGIPNIPGAQQAGSSFFSWLFGSNSTATGNSGTSGGGYNPFGLIGKWLGFGQGGNEGGSSGGNTPMGDGSGGGGGGGEGGDWGSDAYSYHEGGIVGEPTRSRRFVNPSIWRDAVFMHTGGLLPSEVPIIAQRGERVVPASGGGSSTPGRQKPAITIHMPVTSPGADSFRATSGQLSANMMKTAGRHYNRNM